MTGQITKEAIERLAAALEPFAAVAEHDIGADERAGDFFAPMKEYNRAPRLRVGDLRLAKAALDTFKQEIAPALPFLPIAVEGKPEEPNRARVAHAICVALDFPAPQKVKNLLAVREVLDRYYATSSPGKDGGQEVEAVGWETDAERDLENRAFSVANNREVPEHIRTLVEDLWRQYCIAAEPQPASTALVERLERERDYAIRWANKAVADVKEHDCNRIAELETVLSRVEDVIFGSTLRVGSPEYFGVRKLIRSALSASTSREGER